MHIEREKTGVDEANADFLTGVLGDLHSPHSLGRSQLVRFLAS